MLMLKLEQLKQMLNQMDEMKLMLILNLMV